MTLNPLAFPKGVKYFCELCHKIAYYHCTQCDVTYYCCKEHQHTDWEAIHEKICDKLKLLRKPQPIIINKHMREKRDADIAEEKKQLIKLTQETGLTYLYHDQPALALPAALQSLNFSIMLYGPDSLELMPCLLLLAKASVVWGKLSQAKDYLGRASWMLLKTPDAPAAIKSNLHRVQGQLYAAKGKDAEALREFAEDIYQATVAYGTDHIETSGGYFHMANIFFRQGRRLVADSIYRQVTNMWHAYLHRIFMYQTRPAPVPQGVGPGVVIDTEPVVPGLKNLEKLEGLTFLSTIHELRKAQTRCPKREMMLVCLTLGMLQFMLENFNEAKDLGLKAMVLGRQDPHSELSRQAIHFLSICETVKTRA